MDRETRTWRRLAVAGAVSAGLLVIRMVMIRAGETRSAFEIVRQTFRQPGQPVEEDDLFNETWQQQVERRLAACESNAAEVGELRNLINETRAELRKWPGGMG